MTAPDFNEPIYYQGGGFRVTERLLTTPRKTYALARLEYVSVTRPLLALAGIPALGTAGFAIAFWRYLAPGEGMVLLGGSAASAAIGLTVGALRVHSLALRDDDVATSFGLLFRLRHVRRAVEKAMRFRAGVEGV